MQVDDNEPRVVERGQNGAGIKCGLEAAQVVALRGLGNLKSSDVVAERVDLAATAIDGDPETQYAGGQTDRSPRDELELRNGRLTRWPFGSSNLNSCIRRVPKTRRTSRSFAPICAQRQGGLAKTSTGCDGGPYSSVSRNSQRIFVNSSVCSSGVMWPDSATISSREPGMAECIS